MNGVCMLFGHLLTNTAQIFGDTSTYWSPEAVKRVTRKNLNRSAKNGVSHFINSGSATLDGNGRQSDNGKPAMKPFWAITWFVPLLTGENVFRDVYSVMNNWGSNHGIITYGHVGDSFITLASMLRIPVSMHNVPEDRLFRPSAWSGFGTKDTESADYRACKNFGPLYGKILS